MAEEPEEAGRLMCLTWNTHKDVLITLFDDLLREGSLVDCTLAAEGQFIKAHKIIISACSPYLKALLSEHKEQHPIVILNETTFADLKSMLEYMYKGCVNLPKHDIHRFLEQAEHLQIRGLVHGLRTKSSPGSSSLKKNSDDDDGGSGDDRPPPRAAKKARSRKKQKGPAPKRGKKAAVEPQAVEPQAVELIGEEDVKVECPSDDGEPDADNNSEGFPHPHSSSETSNQGDSSEPIAGRSDEQEMEMEGYDSNIDNNSDDGTLAVDADRAEQTSGGESKVFENEKVRLTQLPSDFTWFDEKWEMGSPGNDEDDRKSEEPVVDMFPPEVQANPDYCYGTCFNESYLKSCVAVTHPNDSCFTLSTTRNCKRLPSKQYGIILKKVEGGYECPECKDTIKTKASMARHRRQQHGKGRAAKNAVAKDPLAKDRVTKTSTLKNGITKRVSLLKNTHIKKPPAKNRAALAQKGATKAAKSSSERPSKIRIIAKLPPQIVTPPVPGQKLITCLYCGFTFISQEHVDRHVREKHLAETPNVSKSTTANGNP